MLKLKDLTFFMFVIAIVMIAYGVASRSMAYYPNSEFNQYDISFDGRSIFRQIVYPVYYLMYVDMGNETTYLDGNEIISIYFDKIFVFIS